MANASCATVTLVNTAMVVSGSVSGTILAGMTITGAGVPPGVTVVSGPGGAGTYVVTASAANVTTAEPMVFSLSWDMPLQGNSSFPQLADLGRAAGFGLIFAAAIGGGSAGPGQEYHHGTHAVAIHQHQAISGTHVFQSVKGKQGPTVVPTILTQPQYPEPRPTTIFDTSDLESTVGLRSLVALTAAPQAFDFTTQAVLSKPLLNVSNAFTAEYQFGTHQSAIYNSQIQAQIWTPLTHQTIAANITPRTLVTPPQNVDLTIQGWSKIPSVTTGWIVTMVTAGPQLADHTLQAQLIPARPFLSAFHGPTSPKTIVSVAQDNPTQLAAKIIAPPLRIAAAAPKPFITASPDLRDYTQPQGQLTQAALPGPSKFLQPAFVYSFEQQYDKNLYPVAFQPAVQVGGSPPTGFRVTAVTAGFYGRFRTPGDVFDIASAADFSDSTVNYQDQPTLLTLETGGLLLLQGGAFFALQTQTEGSTSGFGWMMRVPQTTPLFDWLQSNNAPYLPPQDPLRRFIM